jgi:hypothetical protein
MLSEAVERLNKAVTSLDVKTAELARRTGQIEAKPGTRHE